MISASTISALIVVGICAFMMGVSWHFWAWLVSKGARRDGKRFGKFLFEENGLKEVGFVFWMGFNIALSITAFGFLIYFMYVAFTEYFYNILA